MEPNLDSLKQEILDELQVGGFAMFYSESRHAEPEHAIFWDVNAHPDFRAFLRCASQLHVPLVVMHALTFREDDVEDALQDLEESAVEDEEKREMTVTLREMNAFAGLVGSLDLSFDFQGNTYFYYLESDWYREFLDLRDEIDVMSLGDGFEDGPDEPLGGYFSKN
ncbi:MAG: hypothetical protein IT170_15630 [Bryobacterales bacterium]|nr:hypothetical protein [Bryobacterales bacterium]